MGLVRHVSAVRTFDDLRDHNLNRRRASSQLLNWQAAQAAPERLAGWSRHRHRHRDQPHPDRADRDRLGRRLDCNVGRQERDGR